MNPRVFLRVVAIVMLGWLALSGLPGDALGGPGVADKGARPQEEPMEARVQRLITQLGAPDYFVRQRAQEELAGLGFEAFDALTAATTHDDLEIASRARYLLRLMRVEWTVKGDLPEVKEILRDYEFQGEEERLHRMQKLAGLAAGQGTGALCRLARFEKSPVLSKHAALELLARQARKPLGKEKAEEIRSNLDRSQRPAALWLQAWLELQDNPAKGLAEWGRLIDAEQAVLRASPNQTNPRIIAALTRIQVHVLEKLGRRDDALAAMRRLVDLEKGDPEALAELLAWLVEQKAWKVIDEVAERFAPRFASTAGLLYTLAQSQAARGQTQEAEQTARRAFQLSPGKVPQQLVAHLMIANRLRQQGMFAWAKREYRYVIDQGAPGNNITVTGQIGLSEMLHDQHQNLEAAEVLHELVKAQEKTRPNDDEFAGRSPEENRSRMHYFYACHWQGKQDLARQREYLDKALEADATDVDVLIACYRLPNSRPEYRQKILHLIQEEAGRLRAEIADEPENATAYNHFAWLVGNTEGDYDEALRYSKKSLELAPETGGFYDTLARCYYAKGDWENAVKYQTRAAELDPHSGLIARQLELFRKTLEEKKHTPAPKPQQGPPGK